MPDLMGTPMLLTHATVIMFWACADLVVYTYLGYPLLIGCLARRFGRKPDASGLADEELPPISLLIAAYNEEAVVGDRLRNALAMDYPREKLEIVIGSDGSSDGTAEIVRQFARDSVRVLDYPQRRGKASVLNSTIPELKGEIILLSDANTSIDPSAAQKLVRWFRRSDVVAVCGRLVLVDPESGRNADSLYWKYETYLKRQEGDLGALLGANGAIYAIRKDLYVPIPDQTIVDDFVIPLLAKLRTGHTIIYDDEAIAREETPPGVVDEFYRRSRIGAGGFQSLGLLWRLLDPRRGWVALGFLSHKVFRWFCPFFLLGLLASSALLWERPFYRAALIGQVIFYLASLLAALIPARVRALTPLRLATMFTGMNVALLVGFWRWLKGRQGAAWRRTDRCVVAEGAAR